MSTRTSRTLPVSSSPAIYFPNIWRISWIFFNNISASIVGKKSTWTSIGKRKERNVMVSTWMDVCPIFLRLYSELCSFLQENPFVKHFPALRKQLTDRDDESYGKVPKKTCVTSKLLFVDVSLVIDVRRRIPTSASSLFINTSAYITITIILCGIMTLLRDVNTLLPRSPLLGEAARISTLSPESSAKYKL